jgi:hypothetical protein
MTDNQILLEHLNQVEELHKRISGLESQLAQARELLEDCRPLIKGRLLDLDGPHGDWSLLGRIESALGQ